MNRILLVVVAFCLAGFSGYSVHRKRYGRAVFYGLVAVGSYITAVS